MSDWRALHKKELLEKQRHISQKLAQVRELKKLVRKWRELIDQYEDWFGSLERAATQANWFDLDSLTRMGAIAVKLNELIAEFQQVGDPKATGTGSAGPRTVSKEQRLHGLAVQNLRDRAGPLATHTPWELVWELDPEVSESVKQGEYGPAIVQALSSPFTSLGAVEVGEDLLELNKKLLTENRETFQTLEDSWKATQKALKGISGALDGLSLTELGDLETSLESTLGAYEAAYDGAQGSDDTSARLLRKQASGRKPAK